MVEREFQDRRRAIISPDDTFLSAGGGVAEGIMNKAGMQAIINELKKFGRIEHGSIAVTSAGKLPVHYIFHTAAIDIQMNAVQTGVKYQVSENSIYTATEKIIQSQ
jgi:O-acetyl-ADP-ribose deacetylase (regulator of RNase III)